MQRNQIRKTIQDAGRVFYKSLPEGSLRWIAGEIMALNEDYVLNHSGKNATGNTDLILRDGFTKNQKKFLKKIKEAMESRICQE